MSISLPFPLLMPLEVNRIKKGAKKCIYSTFIIMATSFIKQSIDASYILATLLCLGYISAIIWLCLGYNVTIIGVKCYITDWNTVSPLKAFLEISCVGKNIFYGLLCLYLLSRQNKWCWLTGGTEEPVFTHLVNLVCKFR